MEQQPIPFEEALQKLEETVQALEKGNVPLKDMVGLYEEGVRLAKLCNDRLDEYEGKLNKLAPQKGE